MGNPNAWLLLLVIQWIVVATIVVLAALLYFSIICGITRAAAKLFDAQFRLRWAYFTALLLPPVFAALRSLFQPMA